MKRSTPSLSTSIPIAIQETSLKKGPAAADKEPFDEIKRFTNDIDECLACLSQCIACSTLGPIIDVDYDGSILEQAIPILCKFGGANGELECSTFTGEDESVTRVKWRPLDGTALFEAIKLDMSVWSSDAITKASRHLKLTKDMSQEEQCDFYYQVIGTIIRKSKPGWPLFVQELYFLQICLQTLKGFKGGEQMVLDCDLEARFMTMKTKSAIITFHVGPKYRLRVMFGMNDCGWMTISESQPADHEQGIARAVKECIYFFRCVVRDLPALKNWYARATDKSRTASPSLPETSPYPVTRRVHLTPFEHANARINSPLWVVCSATNTGNVGFDQSLLVCMTSGTIYGPFIRHVLPTVSYQRNSFKNEWEVPLFHTIFGRLLAMDS